jgi:hypothetical protein
LAGKLYGVKELNEQSIYFPVDAVLSHPIHQTSGGSMPPASAPIENIVVKHALGFKDDA